MLKALTVNHKPDNFPQCLGMRGIFSIGKESFSNEITLASKVKYFKQNEMLDNRCDDR